MHLLHYRQKNERMLSVKCTVRLMKKRILEHARSADSNQESFFYRSQPLEKTGLRDKHEWSHMCLGLGCYPHGDNPNHVFFVNSNRCCWKATSRVIKISSDPTKTEYDCFAYLFELSYDLLLSVASNVFQTPGFEAFTGKR